MKLVMFVLVVLVAFGEIVAELLERKRRKE